MCVPLTADRTTRTAVICGSSAPCRAFADARSRNGWFKVGIVTIAVAVAVAFAATYGSCRGKAPPNTQREKCSSITSAAAGLEWTDAFMVRRCSR